MDLGKHNDARSNLLRNSLPLRWIAASALLHLGTLLFFGRVAPRVEPHPPANAPQTIAIRMQVAPKARPNPKPAPVPPVRKKREAALPPALQPQSYGDLFPTLNSREITGPSSNLGMGNRPATGADGNEGGAYRPTPALKGQSQLILSHIDIPLKLRTKNDRATAVARLTLTDRNHKTDTEPGWLFAYVDGDPHLRAVLYETLRGAKMQPQVYRLFKLMHASEIYVAIKQSTLTSPAPDCLKGDHQDIQWEKAKITVNRTMYLPGFGCPNGGLLLPDKHWEIAKRRDAVKLQELTSSAAFISPIRNKRPQS